MVKKVLLTNGDSWTYGSEIMAPEFCVDNDNTKGTPGFLPDKFEYLVYNDYYRIPRIWPSFLGRKMDCEVVNLARPARSNDSIYEETVNWILENYITKGKNTDELTVVVGWTDPDRKNIIIGDDRGDVHRYIIWPSMISTEFYHADIAKTYSKLYVKHLWIQQEYLKRYIEQNYQLQNFFKLHKIKYYIFNAFFSNPALGGPDKWVDIRVIDEINKWDNKKLIDTWGDGEYKWDTIRQALINQWNLIDDNYFINKDGKSFRTHIFDNVGDDRMRNWHPSPTSHRAWADYLYNWINK